MQERTREAQRAAETAKHRQERVTKCMERDRAWLSTLTAAALNLMFSYIHCKHTYASNNNNTPHNSLVLAPQCICLVIH